MRGRRVTAIVAVIAVLATISVFATLQWRASRTVVEAGFWYENATFALPDDATAQLGGPLTPAEIAIIQSVSRRELEQAFEGLSIAVTGNRRAFWRVDVLQSLGRRGALPHTGEAYSLGPLGGRASLSFAGIALNAIKHAPPGASRQLIVEGIGRGIGNSAAHEFAHVILGATLHNRDDKNSYEYLNSDRPAQYYGELHWTDAWPLLQDKLGIEERR